VSTYPTTRTGRPTGPSSPVVHAPHAALLIDFDNVTLGIRSDLTKELRTLLDSDIIKGKVAVQRAYADWRRYPQYIVPLSESSIDLIFAPAFGTSKKNATDIRLAVDAIELVFTRPEIGTFMLLSGDSDFSSLVIKLKEYGKYVIGVGIRESASDLLIQNCDEYFSYNDLAGLTREEDTPSIQRDPWELVVEAVGKMRRGGDVMRSDRLKQVMQQIDPNFDERNAGFNRFSKFVSEAGSRSLITIAKLENGQFEVGLPGEDGAGASPRSGRGRGSKRAAGSRGTPPARTDDTAKAVTSEPAGLPKEPAAPPKDTSVPVASKEENGRRTRRGRRGRGRAGGGGGGDRPVSAKPSAEPGKAGALTLAEAFDLLKAALAELGGTVPHDRLRARMVALLGREDTLLAADRFSRLLKQANDADVADVRQLGEESYEVSPHHVELTLQARAGAAKKMEAEATVPPGPEKRAADVKAGEGGAELRSATLRFRRGSRGAARASEVPLVGAIRIDDPDPAKKPARRSRAKQPAADETKTPEAPKQKAKRTKAKKKTAKKSTKDASSE
jgi:uncharacterized protein (TIGR00288 family)